MATKLGRVGIYNQKLPSINSHNPLITWSCKVTWNIRSVISSIQRGLWPPNMARWWLTMRSFQPKKYTTLWTYGQVRPRDKLKTYLYYRNAYASKPGRFITYNEELPSIRSGKPLITWSCKVMWQLKYVISPLP